jgi:hypothetical protein
MHYCLEKGWQLMHNQLKLTPHNEKVKKINSKTNISQFKPPQTSDLTPSGLINPHGLK